MRHALLQKEVDYLLEIGCSARYGYIDNLMIEGSKLRLAERGLGSEYLEYVVTTTNGSDGMNPLTPVERGEGIQLTISYPYESLFNIDRLLNIPTLMETDRMMASGIKMSEYIP